MLIRKRPPKPNPPGTPFRHENHPRPVTRRDFLAAGFLGAQGMVVGSAWLGSLLKAQAARAGGLDADISALLAQGQCNVPSGSGSLPFIVFDLAGGANLVGSEALVGVQLGQKHRRTADQRQRRPKENWLLLAHAASGCRARTGSGSSLRRRRPSKSNPANAGM